MMTTKVFQRVLATFLVVAAIFIANGVAQADPYDDIQKYTAQINQNPNDDDAYYNRGIAYHKLGQYKRAIQDFNKVIQLNPDDNFVYHSRGKSYLKLGQYKLAIQDFNKAIKQKHYVIHSIAYGSRGEAYSKLGQYKQAVKDYNKAIELGADFPETYHNCRLAYKALGNMILAETYLAKAGELYYKRGLDYQEYGDMKSAQRDFAKARELGYNG